MASLRYNNVCTPGDAPYGTLPSEMVNGEIGVVVSASPYLHGKHLVRSRIGVVCLEEADRAWPLENGDFKPGVRADLDIARVRVLLEGETLVLTVGELR